MNMKKEQEQKGVSCQITHEKQWCCQGQPEAESSQSLVQNANKINLQSRALTHDAT